MSDILKEKEIRKKCALTSTFSKGLVICKNEEVNFLKYKKIANTKIEVISQVAGSSNRQYDVNFQVEMEGIGATIQTCNCSCPAFSSYSGLCKHLVASMLRFNVQVGEKEVREFMAAHEVGDRFEVRKKEQKELEAISKYVANTITTASGKTFTSKNSKPVVSSKQLLDTIAAVALQDRNRFCLENANGDVNLEVTLVIGPDSEKLELRIGKKFFYVVKNIFELVSNVKEQNFVKYGKNLEFVHTQSAFSKEAQAILSFLLNLKLPTLNYYNYYRRKTTDERYLTLEKYMLDELMKMFEGTYLYVTSFQYIDKMHIPVIRQDPLLPMKITGKNKGRTISLEFPEVVVLNGVYSFYICWNYCIYICSEEYCNNMREIVKLMAVNWLEEDRDYNHYTSRKLQPLELCEKDYLSFCSTLLPLLEKYMEVRIQKIDFSKYRTQEGRFELYFDLLENQDVICNAKALYGDKEHNLIRAARLSETYRDIKAEYEIRTLLSRYLPEKTSDAQSYLLKNDEDRLAALVEEGIEQFKNLAEVYVSERFKKVHVTNKVTVVTGLSIKGNLLNISWDVTGMSTEELYEILGSYRQKRKYHRLKNGELLNLSNSGLEAFADLQEDLQITKAQLRAGMTNVPLYRTFYMDVLMQENADKMKARRDETFKNFMRNFDEVKGQHYALSEKVHAKLRPYQMEGYRWAKILAELGFGGILADDMGLGKTLQMIAYMCSVEDTHLVVCPASLVYNWEAEFHKFAPTMKVCLMVGNAAEREQLIEQYREYDVVVTSYDLLRRDIDWYIGKKFGCQVIDEAQFIKNPSTQAAKAVKAVESRNRFALTGTPIENRLSELWSIFEYLMPGYLYSYKHFKERFEEDIVQGSEDSGTRALERLHTMIRPFLLRRLKKDVLTELPEKMEEVVYSQFGTEQEKLYKAAEKHIFLSLKKTSNQEFKENKLQVLAEITKLREICCDPALLYENYHKGSAKLDTCLELVESAIEGGHKILVFSQFASMLDILLNKLKERKIRCFLLTGATSKVKRREMVEEFQEGRAEVFLISLKAGGTGLNLTAADVVIHYDPWWNVAAQNQATDRTHRIGQENKVTVLKLIAKNTIEERMIKLQEKKQDLADKIISGEGVSMSSFSREELLNLFRGGA